MAAGPYCTWLSRAAALLHQVSQENLCAAGNDSDLSGTPEAAAGRGPQNVNCLPTAVGARAVPNAFESAVMARQPVQWPAAIVFRLNSFSPSTV